MTKTNLTLTLLPKTTLALKSLELTFSYLSIWLDSIPCEGLVLCVIFTDITLAGYYPDYFYEHIMYLNVYLHIRKLYLVAKAFTGIPTKLFFASETCKVKKKI